VSDPALVARVRRAAEASGARPLDVSVLVPQDSERHVPVVTLEARDPASYLKHGLRDFLRRIGYFQLEGVAFVEVVDDHGRFAWAAGRWVNGGMVHVRPDLDRCSPISHSQPLGSQPPPCPAR
jgi:hypothetical protein